jgi:hypothetical protein
VKKIDSSTLSSAFLGGSTAIPHGVISIVRVARRFALNFNLRRPARISLTRGVIVEGRTGGWIDPVDGVDFVVWTRLPVVQRDERGDGIMGSNAFASSSIASRHRVEGDHLSLDLNLLSEFTGDRKRRPHV